MKEHRFLVMIVCVSVLIVITGAAFMAYHTGIVGNGGTAGALGEPEEASQNYVNQSENEDGQEKEVFARFEKGYDPETGKVEETKSSQPNRLNLLLSSVDHDIKMLILDDDGRIVTGKGFTTLVEGPDESFECEDFDRDGVIYASDLVSGEYNVTLFNENGVQVGDKVGLRIKEEISYTPLVNIEAEVYTEDEVDAVKEDTAENVEEAEASETEPFDADLSGINLAGGSIGVDVSKYNKDINWNDVRASGVEFAIIRIGYRGSSSGVLVVDPYFMKNLAGAKAAGMKIGVYFFTQAVNVTEAVEEASAVTTLISREDLDLPVFMDVESSGGRADGLDTATRTAVINAFCQTLTNAGYGAGVYANKRWYESRIDRAGLDGRWKIWLARYKASEPGMACDCWQYTSKGHVDGIEGNVDLDVILNNGI